MSSTLAFELELVINTAATFCCRIKRRRILQVNIIRPEHNVEGPLSRKKKKRLKKSCEEVRKHKIKHVSQIRCYYTNKLISMVIMKQFQATMPPYCSLENPEENAGCSECLKLRPKQVSSLWRCCEHILTSRWSQSLSKLGGHANKPGAVYS